MPKIEITTTELVWPGKYNEDGTRADVPRVNLPFQVIETVNESRATREARKEGIQGGLFDVYEGKEGDTFEAGWRNKLIWGDNLLVTGSLLQKFSGKFDLIYIDPPFATGSDFSFAAPIGEGGTEVLKEQSIIEEKAYRDTWGMGIESYLGMLYSRLYVIRELLSDRGTLYVHLDWHVGHYVKAVLDELFGPSAFANEIVWRRTNAHNSRNAFGQIHDVIFRYVKSPDATFNVIRTPYAKAYIEGRFTRKDDRGLHDSGDLTGPGVRTGESGQPWWGFDPTKIGRHWQPPKSLYDQLGEDISHLSLMERLEYLNKKGYIIPPAEPGNAPRAKVYAGEGLPLQDIWSYQPHTKGHLTNGSEVDGDVAWLPAGHPERLDYDTQKPSGLLQRIINASSNPGDLVGDFFCGSGTTCAVAERLGRRWIGCDLGRWAIHVSRKRLLNIENSKPFEILNLGMYERQYWQGVTFGEEKDKPLTERALYEYLAFILKLYGAQPLAGLAHIHGKKNKALVHIGAVDAPVTIAEIDCAISECAKLKQGELHVLGWEWEMGLYDLMVEAAKKKGVKLLLLQIPREVMEQQAVNKGDVRFFELAYLEAEIKRPSKLAAQVALKDFVIPNTELIPEEVRKKVKKWSDYIDYWAVDWNFQNDTFMQGWVAYRTRGDRKLTVVSDPYTYDKPGKRRILLKVIDIFGNDTSQAFNIEVK